MQEACKWRESRRDLGSEGTLIGVEIDWRKVRLRARTRALIWTWAP